MAEGGWAGKGIDGFASLRYAAGLPPYGLIASLKVPNSFHGLCPQKNLVAPSPPRGLGSDPISFEYKKGLAFS